MTEPADHLIERAAALLRAANVARLPDSVKAAPIAPPGPPPASRPAVSFPPVGASPLLVPPTRPTPIQMGASRPGPAPVANLPPQPPPPSAAAHPLAAPASQTSTATRPSPAAVQPVISLEALERAGLVVARTKRTRISEEYRIVIGRVLRALHEEFPASSQPGAVARNVVLVTSARPGEGKSFTALNLAGSIAQNAGESVLLVDVDPKIRPISDQLGLGERRGFLDMIVEPDLPFDDLILPTILPNLSVLPLGTRPGTRVATSKVDDGTILRPITPAIHALAQRYPKCLIMLDAPPCLSTSDAHTLAGHVGQVVMVVEAERTQRSEVEAALDLVRVCPTITMLLNKVRLTTSHTFGAYDYFGSYT